MLLRSCTNINTDAAKLKTCTVTAHSRSYKMCVCVLITPHVTPSKLEYDYRIEVGKH